MIYRSFTDDTIVCAHARIMVFRKWVWSVLVQRSPPPPISALCHWLLVFQHAHPTYTQKVHSFFVPANVCRHSACVYGAQDLICTECTRSMQPMHSDSNGTTCAGKYGFQQRTDSYTPSDRGPSIPKDSQFASTNGVSGCLGLEPGSN